MLISILENPVEIKPMNRNGYAFHSIGNGAISSEVNSATIESTGTNEKTGLLSCVNISTMVMDINIFQNPFQSKRKYNYAIL